MNVTDVRLRYVDMSNVIIENTTKVNVIHPYTKKHYKFGGENQIKTCKSSLGYSFAAGTTDGPGMFNFKQGTNGTSGNKFWDFVRNLLHKPSEDLIKCQYPKTILLATFVVLDLYAQFHT